MYSQKWGYTPTHSSPTLLIRQRPINRVCRTPGQAFVNPREIESRASASEQSKCKHRNQLCSFFARELVSKPAESCALLLGSLSEQFNATSPIVVSNCRQEAIQQTHWCRIGGTKRWRFN